MLGMVEIPAKAGASAPYSCLPAGREGRVKTLPFLIGFIQSPYFFNPPIFLLSVREKESIIKPNLKLNRRRELFYDPGVQ
jgi:hypothetical protein